MKVPVKPIYNSVSALYIRFEDGKERVIFTDGATEEPIAAKVWRLNGRMAGGIPCRVTWDFSYLADDEVPEALDLYDWTGEDIRTVITLETF